MAETIASEILISVLAKLASYAMNRYVRSQGIHSELKKLEMTLKQIKNLLTDASEKEIADENVKLWLNSLQHLAYDIDDILDDLATEAMHLESIKESGTMTGHVRKLVPTCCTNFALDNRMRLKLNRITTEFQDLLKEKNNLGLVVKDEKSKNINRKLQTSLEDVSGMVGRKGEKEEFLHKLLGDEPCDQNISVVPIVGMGGVGKTTLARVLYNDEQVKEHFELTAWVCVSDDFDILSISKVIFQSLGGENMEGGNKKEEDMDGENAERENKKGESKKGFADFNLLQVALRNQTREKRFLLVLDDVWSESYEDWEILVRPFQTCAHGSKIIMTTRKEQLIKKLCFGNLNHLQSLSMDDAVCLFAQHALGKNNFDLHLEFKPHGEGIVKKCDGLPLALIALGRLLRTRKDDEEFWKEVLNSEIWRLQDGVGIVPALRLSYQDLSAHLKQLFAYCSLFPKDYVFDKEQLVLLWMAEGFLHQPSSSKSTTEQLGCEYFDHLLSRSFFQHAPNNESLFVIHDLLNDLATSVAGDFFKRLDNEIENDIKKETLEKYRHMSFLRKEYEASKKFEAFRSANSLRTFLATSIGVNESKQTFYLSNKILVDLIPELPLLRVLCLGGYEISEIPESIGKLKHLRYLNLSQTRIKNLPENVGNLYNLETLILFGCHDLIKLPKSFTKLKNLRHFDVRDTPSLKKMPSGIGELKSLQSLSKIIIGKRFELTELKGLKNLCGEISIKRLDKVKDARRAKEVNLTQKRLFELELEWSSIFDDSRKETLEKEVLNELKPCNDSLKQLKIVSYGGTKFPNWVGDPSFHQLKHVSILWCEKCISLPPLGQLASLKELFIKGLDGVKSVGSELLGSGVAFRSLEILSFKDMLGWEEWSTNGGVVFPCLKELSIKDCPKLDVISVEAIASLRVVKVDGCGDGVLRSLARVGFSSVTNLEICNISGLTDEVWGGVIKYLGKVEELTIERCKEIRYLWESEAKASKDLVNLRKLVIWYCNKLVSLGGEKEEDNGEMMMMASLRMLKIYGCKSMERCICPDSIESLSIWNCESMTSISFPKGGGGEKLKSLEIGGCCKLKEEDLGGGSSLLIKNAISGWVNLKSIVELNCYLHLTRLEIDNCSSLESFPELSNLTSLTHLLIRDCPSMDASFPTSGLVWPPKLQSLEIGGLKKPISKWGPQNFPTSLVELFFNNLSSEEDRDVIDFSELSGLLPSSLTTLEIGGFKKLERVSKGLQHLNSLQHLIIVNLTLGGGGPSKGDRDVIDFSELSHLLPSSLTSLHIVGFKKLERVSKGLQHLNSLQHLRIYFCPKVMDLPEMLLPSLLSLTIFESPKLKKRCRSGRGSYWTRISHIPRIYINDEL